MTSLVAVVAIVSAPVLVLLGIALIYRGITRIIRRNLRLW